MAKARLKSKRPPADQFRLSQSRFGIKITNKKSLEPYCARRWPLMLKEAREVAHLLEQKTQPDDLTVMRSIWRKNLQELYEVTPSYGRTTSKLKFTRGTFHDDVEIWQQQTKTRMDVSWWRIQRDRYRGLRSNANNKWFYVIWTLIERNIRYFKVRKKSIDSQRKIRVLVAQERKRRTEQA